MINIKTLRTKLTINAIVVKEPNKTSITWLSTAGSRRFSPIKPSDFSFTYESSVQ
ncbi:hypothetical protein HanPSC8_Chr14g0641721 [Helianthus annuus]|nr:hypothetical protein HanPSC8_Chr14g0641721 [Helianthus annuus]